METALVDTIVESAPYPREEMQPVHSALLSASKYLANKAASVHRPDSPEDLQMRRSGARTQQMVTSFILEHYEATGNVEETRRRNWISGRLAYFWEGYRRLVLQPLAERGIDITRLGPRVGLEQVLEFQNGVKGMVATAVLAKAKGWEVEFPTVDEDVKQGIDLYLTRGGRRVPVQIKCRNGAKFGVVRDGESSVIKVFITGDREFFLDSELGIPHRKHSEQFDQWLTDQLRGLI